MSKNFGKGTYVEFRPKHSTYASDSSKGLYSSVSTDTSMRWRIWDWDDEELVLISHSAIGSVQLMGYDAYNSGVKLLNEICSQLYGSSELLQNCTISCRSICLDDLDSSLGTTYDSARKEASVSKRYGTYFKPLDGGRAPAIHVSSFGGESSRSSQDEWFNGTVAWTEWVRYTDYSPKYTTGLGCSLTYKLLSGTYSKAQTGPTKHTAFWLATRTIGTANDNTSGTEIYFNLSSLQDAKVVSNMLYSSKWGGSTMYKHGLRPLVSLRWDEINLTENRNI